MDPEVLRGYSMPRIIEQCKYYNELKFFQTPKSIPAFATDKTKL